MQAWKSIGSARNSLLAALLVGLFSSLVPARASAQPYKVAVLPVEGPQGEKATGQIVRVVRSIHQLVPDAEWQASAAKLFATSHSASDLAAVAGDLGVQVVITGKVKNTDEGWQLSIGVRHGPTGKATVKLKYPLRGPKVDPATLRKLADELPAAIENAVSGPPGSETPESPETPGLPGDTGAGEIPPDGTTGEATPPGDGEENPLEKAEQERKKAKKGNERPAWAPYLDANVSFVFGGRSFGFDQADTPSFAAAIAPGLQIDGTLFPLAFLAKNPTTAGAALAGIGVGATYGSNFWADSIPCYPDSGGNCLPTTDRFATHEYRYQVGLRWRWNVARKEQNVPSLEAQFQYGEHAFNIQQRAYLADGGARDVGPPDVDYSYMTLGVGARVPFAKRLVAHLLFNWNFVLDNGPITTAPEWGAGSAWGLRFEGGLDIFAWKGLYLRANFYVEHYGISFDQPPAKKNNMPPCPCGTTDGASDSFYGGMLGLGYSL